MCAGVRVCACVRACVRMCAGELYRSERACAPACQHPIPVMDMHVCVRLCRWVCVNACVSVSVRVAVFVRVSYYIKLSVQGLCVYSVLYMRNRI